MGADRYGKVTVLQYDKMGTGTGAGTGAGAGTGTGAGAGAGTQERQEKHMRKEITEKKRGRPKGSKSSYTMSEKAITARKNSPTTRASAPFEGEDIEYNSRQLDHVMAIHEIASHSDKKDVNALKSCFINYLMLCKNDGFKIGNIAACAAMGIDPRTLSNWAHGERKEYKELADFVQMTCALSRENLIADQKINPVIGIFWQRNFDGLRNDTEQQMNLREEQEEEGTREYRKKYGKLLEE